MTPALSIVIPWSNRPELGITLPRNAEAFTCAEAEVIVVNCGGDPRTLAPLVETSGLPELRHIEISAERFNKCVALNIGALVSRAPRLLFLDADIVISPTVLAGMVARTDARAFVTIEWVIDSNASSRETGLARSVETVELVWTDGQRLSFELYRHRAADQARPGPGLICVLKEHFVAVHGMNSRLTTWGWEDLDLIIRLQALHGIERILFGEAQHLAHDDACRTLNGTTRQESQQRNMAVCYANYEQRKFLGTLRRDMAANKGKVIEHGRCGD